MTTERQIIAMGGLLAAVMLLAGCNITLPKMPTWTDFPVPPIVVTNALPTVVAGQAQTNTYTIGKWHGPNGAAAVETFKMLSASVSKGKIRIAYDKPVGWQAGVENTVLCVAFMRDGVWEGGKFDWLKAGQTLKTDENIREGYIKDILPTTDGERCLFWIMKSDGTKRSSFIETEWHQ